MAVRGSRDKFPTLLVVTPEGFAPASRLDADVHARFRVGTKVEAVITVPKSPSQLRLLWRILKIVADNQEEYPDAESLLNAIKINLGYVETIALMGGGVQVEPRSLKDFEGDEFNRFFDQVMGFISEEIIPGLLLEPLINEGRIMMREYR